MREGKFPVSGHLAPVAGPVPGHCCPVGCLLTPQAGCWEQAAHSVQAGWGHLLLHSTQGLRGFMESAGRLIQHDDMLGFFTEAREVFYFCHVP